MGQLGRISGPLLKANLLRNRQNLAFETDLLFLDVVNGRIGINTAAPTHDLTVNGTTRTTTLEVLNQVDIGPTDAPNITINGLTITGNTGTLNLVVPEGNQVIYQTKLSVDQITLDSNVISTNTTNTNLEIRPNGTGEVLVYANTTVYGDIHATGNVTADGDITIGDVDTDFIVFNADVASNIIPNVTDTYTLGDTNKRWKDIWTKNLYSDNIVTGDIVVDNINLNLRQGKIWYVASNGNDTYSGDHQNDPFATVKHALSRAVSGDTVFIYPGTYTEIFPLTVPVGVTVRGEGLRSVTIKPTTATRYNDAFLLNGESTIEDLTVADFFSGGNFFTVTSAAAGTATFNVGTAPFVHIYVSGGTIKINGTNYSINSATYDNTTGIVTVTHTGPDASGQTVFLSNLTFSCNSGNRVFPDNGYAFRFATDFTVTTKSPYIRNVSVITKGSVTSPSDPYGFDSADAGKGAYIDGAYATVSSKEASMLFHSATFITPGVDTITATNGARIEWLNSFTYFANKGLNLISSKDGFAGQGLTRLKIPTRSGTWNVGDTVNYYGTDGTTVLASGTITSVDSNWVNLTGLRQGFYIPEDRAGKTITVHGDAKLTTSVKKFGTASLALDGTGDYISLASSPDFAFGISAFTIEMWVFKTVSGITQILYDQRNASTVTYAPLIFISAADVLVYGEGTTTAITGTTTVPLNQWSHVAVSRSSTSTKLFLNGVQQGSTYTDTRNYIATPVTIGMRFDGSTLPFTGYIDEVRVTKGIARYTTDFAVPTSSFLGDTSAVLLLHFNGLNDSTVITDDGVTFVDIRTNTGGATTDLQVADYSDFGAEIRAIGSACVYGNYGAYGDGPGVIGYLIGQNLAYIGNGKNSSNDPTTVVQTNEIVELNDAKIYYNSVDHKGDFRVGDLFYVNQQTGEVTFSNSDIQIGNSLTFADGLGNVTYIDASKIETGDFRISGNTVQTLTQDFNVLAASDQINLQNNVNIAGNLDVVGNVSIAGNLTLGDQPTDIVIFVASIGSDIIPATTNLYSLGTTDYEWKSLFTGQITSGNVRIDNNTITTTVTNTDLVLSANGTGKVYIPSNNVQIDNVLTVNSTTNLKATNIGAVGSPSTVTHVGNTQQTGNITQTGNISVTGTFTTTGTGQFTDIRVSTNEITTTIGNNDLRLLAAGTGVVYVPNNNVLIDNNLTVNGTLHSNALTVTTSVDANAFSTGDILIDDNIIKTTLLNNDLILQAAGSGRIYVPYDNVQFDQNLTVNGTTNLKTTNIVGTVTHTGNVVQTGNVTQTGNTSITGTLTVGSAAQFKDIKIDNNVITTTLSNNDLILGAAGTGRIYVPSDAVEFGQTLTVVGTTTTSNINNTNTVTSDQFSTGDILIDNNVISTTLTNSNLVLQPNGTGIVSVPNNSVQFDRNLTVLGTTNLKTTNIVGTLTHTGNVTQTGNVQQTGNFTLNGILTVNNTAQFKDIKIENNVITTTIGNNDLELASAGTGRIYVPQNDVRIAQNLTVVGTTTSSTINNSGTITSGTFSTGNIQITGNTIQTTTTNSNLQLQANGTGLIELEQFQVQENELRTSTNTDIIVAPHGTGIVNINSNQSIKVPVGTTTERPNPATAGMIRFNTTLNRYEGFDGTNWIRLDGVYDLDENTYVTAELSHGTNDNTFRFVSNGVLIADLDSTRLNAQQVQVDSININDNIISTTTTDTNISFQTTGTGAVRFENFSIVNNVITNTVSNSNTLINQTGNGYFKIGDTNGFVIPAGTNEQRPTLANTEVGMMRFNTSDFRVEIWDGSQWISAAGSQGAITAADAQDISILTVLMLG